MTDKQIKQNAEQYAIKGNTRGSLSLEILFQNSRDAYIAGAHSRDEEISQWKLAYNNLLHNFNERGNELVKQSIELDQLRNPWISINDRLPRDEDYDEENLYCFLVRLECGFIYNSAFDGEEWLTNAPNGEEWCIGDVTHWMPIPKV